MQKISYFTYALFELYSLEGNYQLTFATIEQCLLVGLYVE